MVLIRDIVQRALVTGYLTLAAEEELRHLMQAKYGAEDFSAFMKLQRAAMEGIVKQESRELADRLIKIGCVQGSARLDA